MYDRWRRYSCISSGIHTATVCHCEECRPRRSSRGDACSVDARPWAYVSRTHAMIAKESGDPAACRRKWLRRLESRSWVCSDSRESSRTVMLDQRLRVFSVIFLQRKHTDARVRGTTTSGLLDMYVMQSGSSTQCSKICIRVSGGRECMEARRGSGDVDKTMELIVLSWGNQSKGRPVS